MHEHYLRKNRNKNRDFVSIQLLTWQRGDKRKSGWREGWGGGLIIRGEYFKYFGQRGAIIQGTLLFEEYMDFNIVKT